MSELAVWQRTIVDEEGNIVPLAEIEVRHEHDDSLATIYADRDGGTGLNNPLTADTAGFARFYAEGGAYKVTATGAGSEISWRFVAVGTLAERDRALFESASEVENSHINPGINAIRTNGYHTPGDGGGALYVEGDEVPGAIQSGDGRWWELVGSMEIGPMVPEDVMGANSKGGTIRRPYCTTQALNLFVDGSVSTSGDGSSGSPFKTIDEAVSKIPRLIFHSVRVYIADGTYTGLENSITLLNLMVTPRATGLAVIGHTPEHPWYNDLDPSAVVIGNESSDPGGPNTNLLGGIVSDVDDVYLSGVTLDGWIQCYTNFSFYACIFKTGRSGTAEETRLVDGHSGRVSFSRCHFENADIAVRAQDLAWFLLNGCTGANIGRAALIHRGSRVDVVNSDGLRDSVTVSLGAVDSSSLYRWDGCWINPADTFSFGSDPQNPVAWFSGVGAADFNSGRDVNADRNVNADFNVTAGGKVTAGGTITAGSFFTGGAASAGDPGENKFSIYMDPSAGHLNVRINLGGVVENYRLVSFGS